MCIRKVGASGIGPKRDIDGESRVIGVLEKGVTLSGPPYPVFAGGVSFQMIPPYFNFIRRMLSPFEKIEGRSGRGQVGRWKVPPTPP